MKPRPGSYVRPVIGVLFGRSYRDTLSRGLDTTQGIVSSSVSFITTPWPSGTNHSTGPEKRQGHHRKQYLRTTSTGDDIILTSARYEDVDRFALLGRGLLARVSPRVLPGGVKDLQDATGPLILHNDAANLRVSISR